MVNKKTLSAVMKELGRSKSDKKIASSMANLEKANKARKLIMEMAKRRKADCKETGIVVKKRIAELMKNGKS